MFESSGHPGSTWPVLCFHRACRKGESALLFLPGPGFCWVQATARSRWFLQGSCPVALGWQTEGCLSNVLTCTLGIYCEVNFYLSLINARRLQASHHVLCSPFQSWIFCFRLFFSTHFTILLLACLWGGFQHHLHVKIRDMLHNKWWENHAEWRQAWTIPLQMSLLLEFKCNGHCNNKKLLQESNSDQPLIASNRVKVWG